MATYIGELISRGAEAEIYLVNFFGLKSILKKRVHKAYRNQFFDELFIKSRTRIEAKILSELYYNKLNVPAVYFFDDEQGVIIMEYIEGHNLSRTFESLTRSTILDIAHEIGSFAGCMHSLGIYHGDFTLANVLFANNKVVIIDFGLSGYSTDIEEYAIDLHLMRRSIHVINPDLVGVFMDNLLDAYRKTFLGNPEDVFKRMREISARGRYIDRELRKSIMRERYID
ncbi:MAG: KEOPS complex kinase/ATPase Bud32 [Desulfurococcaceae archaeon]